MNDDQMEWAPEAPTKTLRDEFAMAALTGIIASHGVDPGFDLHADAFRQADAMMKARGVGS